MRWLGNLCDACPVQAQLVAQLALAGLLTALVIVVGLRIFLHRRTTGTSGVTAFRHTTGTPQWWGGNGFVLGFIIIVLGMGVSALGWGTLDSIPLWAVGLGVGLGAFGAGGAWLSQQAMGDSWGFGVSDESQSDLVTKGIFGVIRNPIYTFMLFGLLGCLVMVPNVVTALGWLLLFGSVQYLVRSVEEPFLLRTIPGYADYAASTGRFLPGIGLIRARA